MLTYWERFKNFYLKNFTPRLFEIFRAGYHLPEFKQDCLAALTTTVVSIPLSMALAIASGVSPAQGLYTAVIAGFLVALLGGSRYQIGGPTGAFVIVIFTILQQSGYSGLVMTMLIAGLLLIIAGFFRIGSYIKYIPYPVIIGFTSGIGVLLISTQIKDLLGLSMTEIPAQIFPKWIAYFKNLDTINLPTVLITVLSFGLIFGVRKFYPRLPAMLLSVIGSTVIVVLFSLNVDTIGSQFGGLPQFLPKPTLPSLNMDLFFQMIPNGLTVAFLAGVESLLSAKVIDGMSGDNHNPNAELIGQGVANIACTCFSGIPATGAIARTVTNFKAGAYSPVSAIMQSVFLLSFMLLFAPLAKYIPLASLAVVLILVAYNMLNVDKLKELILALPGDKITLIVTLFLTIFVDLNTAISVGVILACIIFMHRMSKEFAVETDEKTAIERMGNQFMGENLRREGILTIRVSGPLFFGGISELSSFFRKLDTKPKIVILRMNQVPMVDASGANLILDFIKGIEKRKAKVILCHIRKQPRRVLHEAFLREHLKWKTVSIASNYTNALKMCRKLIHQ